MGLYKGKVQSIFTGPYILPSADKKEREKRGKKVSREKVRTKNIYGKKRSYLSRSTKYLVLD
jgi:hypothetical protein